MAVHDAALGGGRARENELLQVRVDLADQLFVAHLIVDVRLVCRVSAAAARIATYAIEGGDEHARLLQSQRGDDVLLHPARRSVHVRCAPCEWTYFLVAVAVSAMMGTRSKRCLNTDSWRNLGLKSWPQRLMQCACSVR